MASTTTDYPIPVFHFSVDWGSTKATFSEVSGLSNDNEVIEYRDGLSPEYTKMKMPGLQSTPNITLKRGVFKGDNGFYEWWDTIKMNTVQRRDVTISLLNEDHQPVMTWNVRNAWPVKVDSPTLNAEGNEVAVESMELANEGVSIAV